MFFWFSGLAVVAIVLVEFLVCFAVMAFFRRHPDDAERLEDGPSRPSWLRSGCSSASTS